jgi:hypothetical protein
VLYVVLIDFVADTEMLAVDVVEMVGVAVRVDDGDDEGVGVGVGMRVRVDVAVTDLVCVRVTVAVRDLEIVGVTLGVLMSGWQFRWVFPTHSTLRFP